MVCLVKQNALSIPRNLWIFKAFYLLQAAKESSFAYA
jgi:hypothetical protein